MSGDGVGRVTLEQNGHVVFKTRDGEALGVSGAPISSAPFDVGF